jgi:predicted ester cyclase
MTELDQDIARQWFEEVWNKGRREAIAEFLSPDALLHEGGADVVGPDGFYPFFDRFSCALSGIHVEIEDSIAAGDKVCVRWSFTAKHTGEGLEVPPTDVPINITGITIMRIANGQLVEGWQNWDMLGLMEQIRGLPKAATYVAAG